jgi:hypothetical protein
MKEIHELLSEAHVNKHGKWYHIQAILLNSDCATGEAGVRDRDLGLQSSPPSREILVPFSEASQLGFMIQLLRYMYIIGASRL